MRKKERGSVHRRPRRWEAGARHGWGSDSAALGQGQPILGTCMIEWDTRDAASMCS